MRPRADALTFTAMNGFSLFRLAACTAKRLMFDRPSTMAMKTVEAGSLVCVSKGSGLLSTRVGTWRPTGIA